MIFLSLFLEFFKIGLFSFGGAFGMIPLIKETVLAHGWIEEGAFYDLIGICESTPGPIAVNMATYIGSLQAGLLGSIVATLGVVLPSFLIILLIASILKNLTKNEYFKAVILGVKPVVAGLVLSTGAILLAKAFGLYPAETLTINGVNVTVFTILTALYFMAKYLFKKKIGAIPLILISVLLGIGTSVLFEFLA